MKGSTGLAIAFLLGAGFSQPAPAQQPNTRSDDSAAAGTSIRITSPLGRTGLVTRVRIVAQVKVAPGNTLSPLNFFVDGELVGTIETGPPYAVDWTDENPFERREIVVQGADSSGRTVSDTVVLPPYEVNDRTEVTSVLIEASVYDKAGRFVSNLEPSAFTVRENGVGQVIDLVTRESLPTNLVLLVDNSQSMSRRMDFVRSAATRLARALRAQDRVIVAPFNARVGTITGPTNDVATISDAIATMRAQGGTAILDSIAEAARLLVGLEGRRAVILITDGYDEDSGTDIEEALRSVEEAQATTYVIGIGGVAGISLRGESMLRRLADRTGGRVFFPPREPELVTVASEVVTDSHSRYLITYTPANQKKDGTWREVSVEAADGLRVRTRAGYLAPAPPPIRPTVEFTMRNAAREYVAVNPDDFEVREDGVTQQLDTFQEAVDPVSIVMVLDASGSMKKAADLVRATARDFVRAVRPEDDLALITFADQPKFAHTLAANREWTLEAIDEYVADGGTALYDALWNSLMHLKDVRSRRAVVVLTDGRDEDNPGTGPGSIRGLDQVIDLGREVGAMIFPIGLGTNLDRPLLERLATEFGGQAFFASDASELGEQFRLVVESLRRRYVISYSSSNSAHDGTWRTVEILPKASGHTVSSRGGYFAPDE
jgi:VWFA-related protein